MKILDAVSELESCMEMGMTVLPWYYRGNGVRLYDGHCSNSGDGDSLETSSPFVDYLIDNGLLQARADLDQALLQLIHIFHRLLVYMMLYMAPNAVVDRVGVEAVGRPAVRRDERWCLTTQKLNRRTCPTNGEDVSGPVSE